MKPERGQIIAVWVSCGAASAVAAKLTLDKYPECDVRLLNNPVMEEDADNRRFLRDVGQWLGREIEIVVNVNFQRASAFEVWEKRKFMSSPKGAPCTLELKKKARQQWENRHNPDWHVLGFTVDERHRYENFILTERKNTLPVLIEKGLRKVDCFAILNDAGIQLPQVYWQGYPNANCIGCVKATSPTYWNHVRKWHPEQFKRRADQSQRLGAKLARYKGKRVQLHDLPATAKGRSMKSMKFECGIFCEEKI